MRNLQESINYLRRSDEKLAGKVQAIELLVAGTYVRRDELSVMSQALFAKLDKIEDKLDNKVDKADYKESHAK